MMRSLFSGVSGLKVHQTKMDVIGNNISNVNTVGFKGSSVNFSDIFYQTTQSASGPNTATGSAGRNAMQIGLGAGLSSITANISGRGGSQRTDNPFDVMINGDGFFVVNSGGTNYFTKAGSFKIDADGNLCTDFGAYVMGWQPAADGINIKQDAVSKLQIMAPGNMYTPPAATTAANVSGNVDKKDPEVKSADGKKIQYDFYDDTGAKYTAQYAIKQDAVNDRVYGVDFKDITDINGDSIFVSKTVAANGTVTYGPSAITNVQFDGVTYTAAVNVATGEVTLTGPTADTLVKLGFNADGTYATVNSASTATLFDPANIGNKAVSLTIGGAPSVVPFKDVSIDFSSLTMYETGGKCKIETAMGALDGTGKGKKVGNMSNISIDQSGQVFGSYDNGDKKLLGQIVVARFANPSGLEAIGNNLFAETQNSGNFDGIGGDPSSEGESLTTGVLEMSNVDLSSEFTSMITTQRGFQANSRIITTSDTMLEELINLKR